MQQSYDLPQTEDVRKYCLREVHSKWKDFKYILTRDYVKGKKQGEDPCLVYLIPTDQWRTFIASRHDPKFVVKSFSLFNFLVWIFIYLYLICYPLMLTGIKQQK